jgi:large subunit ribosomal protein L4
MTSLTVINSSGERVEEIEIPESILDLAPVSGVVNDVIRQHQAAIRRGTAAVKNRSLVVASGRKPWRQKGTGRARAGDRSSPIWRGGGVVFGPRPRSYDFKVSKKAKRKALKSILSIRFRKGQVIVIDRIELEEPRTRNAAGLLAAVGAGPSVLIITPRRDRDLTLAVRNIPGVEAIGIRNLNTFTVVSYPRILITREALVHLQAWMEKIK